MSDAHDPSHAPAQPEQSHPLLWTILLVAAISFLAWLFSDWFAAGRVQGRAHGRIVIEGTSAEAEPNHKELIESFGQDVIDKGQVIYNGKCAACHGAQGNSNPANMSPAPRNFQTDAWKNPAGGGPYGLYTVLIKGYGSMPAFPGLSAEEKYQVIHYIRESWVKTANKNHYVADSAEMQKTIPAVGLATGEGGDATPANERSVKVPVRSLMAGIAADQAQADANSERLFLNAYQSAPVTQAEHYKQLDHIREQSPQLFASLLDAIRRADRDRFITLLAGSDGSGAVHPYFSLLREDQMTALFLSLKGGK